MNDILTIQKEVLTILENIRKDNPSFRYKPRQKDNNGRLSAGYNFIGNDHYLMIGLTQGGDKLRKIHNIGIAIHSNGATFLTLSAKNDRSKLVLLEKIANEIEDITPDGAGRWVKPYRTSNYKDALKLCIESDLPIILKAINSSRNKTNIKEITQSKFDGYLAKILKAQTIEEKIARICWNEKGWQLPSGKRGKSANKDSYEASVGYGHEEWLLNPTRTINGYHYSFLQQLNIDGDIHIGRTYKIHLYTINPDKVKCYVGYVDNVECINDILSQDIFTEYKKNGWISAMEKEVNCNLNLGEHIIITNFSFNIRFKLSDIHIGELRKISKSDTNIKTNRYKLLNKLTGSLFIFDTADDDVVISGGTNKKSTTTRTRTVNATSNYEPVHNQMQMSILNILEASGEYTCVKLESDFVDIKAITSKNEMHYFEIKTDIAKHSIRQALGQILEYNHYPNNQRASELCIISQYNLTDDDKAYIKLLRSVYKLPIFYRWYDFSTNRLANKY